MCLSSIIPQQQFIITSLDKSYFRFLLKLKFNTMDKKFSLIIKLRNVKKLLSLLIVEMFNLG